MKNFLTIESVPTTTDQFLIVGSDVMTLDKLFAIDDVDGVPLFRSGYQAVHDDGGNVNKRIKIYYVTVTLVEFEDLNLLVDFLVSAFNKLPE